MDIVVKIVGIVIVFLGVLFLLRPDITKKIFDFFGRGRRIYIAGVARLVLAVVFLLAARECDITWVIAVFGILFLISGLSIFMIGAEKLKSMLSWFRNKSPLFIRAMALAVLAIGAVIIYSA
jgi:hypothetical protein